MNLDVYVEPGLLKNEVLHAAYFIKGPDCYWVLQSALPKTRNIDEYKKMSQEDILRIYPELKELFDLKLEKNIIFRKGINSGKWYDFH